MNSYGHDLPPEARFGHVRSERWAGRKLDLGSRPDLAELIRAIDGIRTADGVPAIPRLRFITSHPWDLSDRLIEAMADCPSLCESLHLPVQSGDDEVLRRMGRQYTIEHYLERLEKIRAAVPGITVSTDIIVGFCGETEAAVRADAPVPRGRPLRPGLLGRLLGAPGHARRRASPTTSRRPRSGDGSTRCSPSRSRSASSATGPGSGATSRSSSRPSRGPRSHDHDDGDAAGEGSEPRGVQPGPGEVALSGRTRGNKLVHLAGDADWIGRLVTVRVDHAGPYALRGVAVA